MLQSAVLKLWQKLHNVPIMVLLNISILFLLSLPPSFSPFPPKFMNHLTTVSKGGPCRIVFSHQKKWYGHWKVILAAKCLVLKRAATNKVDRILLWFSEYGKSMEADVASDVSGDFKRALVSLIGVSEMTQLATLQDTVCSGLTSNLATLDQSKCPD